VQKSERSQKTSFPFSISKIDSLENKLSTFWEPCPIKEPCSIKLVQTVYKYKVDQEDLENMERKLILEIVKRSLNFSSLALSLSLSYR
jgi:hypothetical protein